MLNLSHARTFLAVIDERGFRSAARKLAVAPSTIVDHIHQLESELAAPLIVRRRGQIEPTAQGALFTPLARALVDTALRARRLLSRAGIRLAASSNVGTYLLQPVVASFQSACEVTVEQWIGGNLEVAERLQAGRADVAVMEWWDGRPGFDAAIWRREPLVVIVGRQHPWFGRREVAAQELVGPPILGGEAGSGTGGILRSSLGRLAARLVTVPGYGSTEAVKRAVAAGQGISIVLEQAVADEVAEGSLAALQVADVNLGKEIRVVTPASLPPQSLSAQFVGRLLSSVNGELAGMIGRPIDRTLARRTPTRSRRPAS